MALSLTLDVLHQFVTSCEPCFWSSVGASPCEGAHGRLELAAMCVQGPAWTLDRDWHYNTTPSLAGSEISPTTLSDKAIRGTRTTVAPEVTPTLHQ